MPEHGEHEHAQARGDKLQGGTLSRLVPGFSVRTWEIQRAKSHKNEKVTVDFSVRTWEIQEEKFHKNEKVTALTAATSSAEEPAAAPRPPASATHTESALQGGTFSISLGNLGAYTGDSAGNVP
eukprot:SAG31_NODE_3669_length_4005_cov_1.656938_6_plen_124_part_00